MKGKRIKSFTFCEVCCHEVVNLAKHIETQEHKRQLKRQTKESTSSRPRLPGQPIRSVGEIGTFPGRLRLGNHGSHTWRY